MGDELDFSTGSPAKDKVMEKNKVIDFLNQVLPGVGVEDVLRNEPVYSTHSDNTRVAIQVPSVGGQGQQTQVTHPVPPKNNNNASPIKPVSAPTPPTPPKPQGPAAVQNSAPSSLPKSPTPMGPPVVVPVQPQGYSQSEINAKFNEVYKIFDGYVSLVDLNNFKNALLEEISQKIFELSEKFKDFQKHTMPERVTYEAEAVYKNRVFEKVAGILDDIFIPIFDGLAPDYSLLSVQNTKYFNDGTICNSLVNVNVKLYYQNIQINFSVEVPILMGVIYAPMYIQKQNKLVPIIKDELWKELIASQGLSDNGLPIDTGKPNLFSPVDYTQRNYSDNTQKEYSVLTPAQSTYIDSKGKPDYFNYNAGGKSNSPIKDFSGRSYTRGR